MIKGKSMATKEIQFAQLIWQVRRLFQRLASESNDLIAAYGITASQRAVLEFLDHNEPETLANMARAHDVSRQHIQQTVNDLLEKKLVESIENPAHKRSFLVQRTKAGGELFDSIKQIEKDLFKKMVKQFDAKAIEISLETLNQLNSFLHSDKWLEMKQQYTDKEN